ncbi:MAG: TlpA disulfide reductase family protein [Desulfopila sp.]|jgi:thiol-disulfide isomerase/thioredoxin|nr:TlpA disulfide reductase family protein [Desulfopila sp.]
MTARNIFPLLLLLMAITLGMGTFKEGYAAEPLPPISLIIPENQEYRDYLGLKGTPGETFALAEVDADILLIELFSMYCPYCQEEAPLVNEFHALARLQEEKGITIKLVGLGASNTQFEVDFFRDEYNIEFPLFPDKDLSFYKKLKGEGTPGFIGCLLRQGEDPVIVVRQTGGFDSAEEFLGLLLQRAGFR